MDKAKASGEGDDEQADNSNSIANTKTKARRKRRGRPLEALDLRFRPLAPHAVSWSCDAELAVALDEAIHIFLPELGRGEGVDEEETAQFSVSLQVAGLFRPEPPINARLCAEEGVDIGYHNDDFTFAGVGSGLVTRSGAALGQTVRVEWSPTGLGHCLRPVLAVLTTSGCLVVVGDVGADDDGGGGGGGGGGLTTATRSFRNWRVLWGLGAGLPVPDEEKGVRSVQDKIVSMAWARHLSAGKALLSYGTDSGQVVILTVELVAASKEAWRVRELSRFDGRGPHHEVRDADSVVCGTAFGLRWSPWLEGRTAMVAYVADNYLGFRRVFVDGEMTVTVDDVDSAAMCLFLGVDAFVEWEDAIWPADDGGWVARGIIATPLVAKAFQVHLCKRLEEPMAPHRTQQCATASPAEDSLSTNPITGLIVHPPDSPDDKPSTPRYTLVRLSATATNHDWYESTCQAPLPQWAEYVAAQTRRLVPRLSAMQGLDSDSDSEDMEDEEEEEEGEEGEESSPSSTMTRLHPHRFRFWGLAASPGHGSTAVLVSKHSTVHAHRRARSRLLFGWTRPQHVRPLRPPASTLLTTEGRLWEAAYGGADALPLVASAGQTFLREAFRPALALQRCVFCDALLGEGSPTESRCENGHCFATCAATGLAIMAPGASRLCAVCGLRCLKAIELARLARRYLGPEAGLYSAGDACGGCGGKFVS